MAKKISGQTFLMIQGINPANILDLRKFQRPVTSKESSAKLTERHYTSTSFFRRLVFDFIKLAPIALILIIVSLPFMSAFEAHVVNVTASLVQIDPPILTPPGANIPWYDTTGATSITGTLDVIMTDDDPDATHIYYTYASGIDSLSFLDPVCGQTGPNGGGDVKTNLIDLSFTSDTVIKAIACNGPTISSEKSVVNIKIYDPPVDIKSPENFVTPEPSDTPTPTANPTPSPTVSGSPASTPSTTPTPSPIVTSSPDSGGGSSSTASDTPTPAPSPSATPTPEVTPEVTPDISPTPTPDPTSTPTPEITPTPTPIPTLPPEATTDPTPTPSESVASTPEPGSTITP
jgi:hypothetical protein